MSKHQRVETKREQAPDVNEANKQTLDVVLQTANAPNHLYKLPGDLLVQIVPFLGLLPAIGTLPSVSLRLMKFAPSKEVFLIAPERLPVSKLKITEANAVQWFVEPESWLMEQESEEMRNEARRRRPNFIRTMQLYGGKIVELTIDQPWEPVDVIVEHRLFPNLQRLALLNMQRTLKDRFLHLLQSFPMLHNLECQANAWLRFVPADFATAAKNRTWTRLVFDFKSDRDDMICFNQAETLALANTEMTAFVWKPYTPFMWRKDKLPAWTYSELELLAAQFDPTVLTELVMPQEIRAEDRDRGYLLFLVQFRKLTQFSFGYPREQLLRHDVWTECLDVRDRLNVKNYERDEKQPASPMRDHPPRNVHWQRSTLELAFTLADTLFVANVPLSSLSSDDWNIVLATPGKISRAEFLIPAQSVPTAWSPSLEVTTEAVGDLQILRITRPTV